MDRVRATVIRVTGVGDGSFLVADREYQRITRVLEAGSRKENELVSVVVREIPLHSLRKSLTRTLRTQKKTRPNCLVMEVLARETTVRAFDDICQAIHTALTETSADIDRLLFVVADESDLADSVLVQQRLRPWCRDQEVDLLVASATGGGLLTALEACRSRPPRLEGERVAIDEAFEPDVAPEPLTAREMRDELEVLVGHFRVPAEGGDVHVPAVVSVGRLARSEAFVAMLAHDAEDMLGEGSFVLIPVGLDQGGLHQLSLRLVAGDSRRIRSRDAVIEPNLQVIVLTDLAARFDGLEGLVRKIQGSGSTVAVLGIAQGADTFGLGDVQMRTYIDLSDMHRTWSPSECPMCAQKVELLPKGGLEGGATYETYARSVGAYEPHTFWQLADLDPQYLDANHWASDRTPNHYDLRVVSAPLFQDFGWDVATRIRNMIESAGILQGWLRGILCTEGEESGQLAIRLSELLGVGSSAVLRVPRDRFRHISGRDLGESLTGWLLESDAASRIRGKNVLILDQAAHHFRTYSSLRRVADYLECTSLAFAVFLDRTSLDLDIGEFLHSSHYIALYSWPAPPRRDCPCTLLGGTDA